MSYTFRKYAGYNPNDIKCWTLSSAIETDNFDVENIVSKRGAAKAGTAIPSPLARLELFDTAFHIVSTEQKNNLTGTSIYHQLVSDCLDVMQMLFNSNESDIGPGKKIWFKEWKVQENLTKLKSKGPEHPNGLLAKSFSQIFDDTSNNNGFAGTESIFLIYYENHLLGGTSPLTLFFTSPNWERYIKDGEIADIPRSSDDDIFFDNNYRPLHEREHSFIEYLYKLSLQNPQGFSKVLNLKKYLNRTIDIYFPEWRHKYSEYNVQGNTGASLETEYGILNTNIENKRLVINGIYFHHQKQQKKQEKIASVSDFIINSTSERYARQFDREGNEIKVEAPLVLLEGMNYPGDYIEKNSPWNSNTKIKYFLQSDTPLYERRLPQLDSLTVTYPFVTLEDFLEDYLVEMPYKLNQANFYTGYSGDFKYLLPIKKEYFNFFELADLKKNISLTLNEGEVTVRLKVPVKNRKGVNDIVFIKTYEKKKSQIIQCNAGLGIFPFFKVDDPDPKYQALNDYTILLAERNDKLQFEALNFYSYSKTVYKDNDHLDKIENKSTIRSTQADVDTYNSHTTSRFFRVKEAFDYIEFNYKDSNDTEFRGLVIPNFDSRTFSKANLTKKITFAIDFGTSNTHIAFKEGNGVLPLPFEASEEDQQMVLLNAPGVDKDLGVKYGYFGQFPEIDLTLKREFIPSIIKSAKHSTVAFPFKTATCEISAFNNMDKSSVELFSHINIGYHIDKEEKASSNIIYTTNLKWLLENNIDDSNRSRVMLFLKQLLIQIKAKAILSYCKPEQLDILWSIPSSMDTQTKTTLKQMMKVAFSDVFPNYEKRQLALLDDPIKESVAPYFFLTKSDSGIQEGANVINIDIGGGTSDVMMFMESTQSRKDKYLTTSFRFAGNDIWGSGYKGKLKDNGFVKNYLAYKNSNNINPDENKYFSKAQDDGNLSSDDLISLLFKYDTKFKFSNSIVDGNTDLSLILYLHYSAIIYHICQIIDIKDYPLPRYLSFTGKGSQYIRLLCNNDESELNKYTKLLFKAYSNKKLQSSFRVHLNEDPKVITANGSIEYHLADRQDQFIEVPKNESFEDYEHDERKKYQEFIHPGFNSNQEGDLLKTLLAKDKQFIIEDTLNIDDKLNVAVLNNINDFLDKTLGDKDIIDFLNGFKVKNPKTALTELRWTGDIFNGDGLVYDSYKKVLKDLHKQDKQNQLSESLFFYALKDALYRLSKSITGSKS